MSTEEGNKLIAEFMNWQHHEDKGYDAWEMANLNYHTSWDWLMPVVEKIQAIPPNRFVIDNNESKIIGDTKIKVFNESKILSVWECAIQFITWHNKLFTNGNKNKSTK